MRKIQSSHFSLGSTPSPRGVVIGVRSPDGRGQENRRTIPSLFLEQLRISATMSINDWLFFALISNHHDTSTSTLMINDHPCHELTSRISRFTSLIASSTFLSSAAAAAPFQSYAIPTTHILYTPPPTQTSKVIAFELLLHSLPLRLKPRK